MSRLAAAPRWAISFADLSLLLLGCFVILHSRQAAIMPGPAAVRPTDPAVELSAAELFETGEARLTTAGRARLSELARTAEGRRIAIVSRGSEDGGRRFDSFELAAARTAAISRALAPAERDVTASIEEGDGESEGQHIYVHFQR